VNLTEIIHSGSDIGDDWRYQIIIGGETVSIDGQGHGDARERIELDPPIGWTLRAQDCGADVSFDVQVKAEEEDLFLSDLGEKTRNITVRCPDEGEGPNEFHNQQIVARVAEEPAFLRKVHWVTFVFDIETTCTDD
jgi:hypothetical protein